MAPICVDVNESSHTFESEADQTEPVYQYEEVFLWLLKHLDNPYPSISTKRALCKRSGLVMKAVNEWFSHARRRIGWTSLMKRHFKGDRQLTIDCAHRILVENSGPLYYSDDICQDVENMRDTAEHLFAKKSRQSSLSRIFDNKITESMEPPRRLSSSFSRQPPPPVSTLAQISPYDETKKTLLPPRSELASEPQNDVNTRIAIKKKRARDSSDEGTGFESWRGGLAEATRPMKRLKCVLSVLNLIVFFLFFE